MKRLLNLCLMLTCLAGCEKPSDGALHGYVEGDYLYVAAPDAGWITMIAVDDGDKVAAGAPLFTLDATREQAALAQAQAGLDQAVAELADRQTGSRTEEIAGLSAQLREAGAALRLARQDLDRQKALAADNVAARARLEQAQAHAAQMTARVERMRAELATARLPARPDRLVAGQAAVAGAQAALAQAQWRLDQRRILSPVDARVDEVVRDTGEWAPANALVVSLLPPGAVKLVLFIPERRRAELSLGKALSVTCDGCKPSLTASVTRIASEAEYTPPVIYSRDTAAKLVYRVEARLTPDPAALIPGQPVTAMIRTEGAAP